jgi:hypothetical protein
MGKTDGLEWQVPEGKTPLVSSASFEGHKAGIYNSHVAYVAECLTAMAFYCLVQNDDAHGRKAAAAIATLYRMREPLVDQWLQISDSEFGSSLRMPDGSLVELNALGARTHWRNIHGLVFHMNLGLSLEFGGKWMTSGEIDSMRRLIAKATYGRRSYAQDAPVRFRDVNWMSWDLPHFLAVAAIEGLPGFDPEAYAAGAESVRAFCDWGIDEGGVVYESTGKSPGALQFQLLAMMTLARRGENLFGHPHWRRLLEGTIQMTSPNGRVHVDSGTQYAPYSRQKLSPYFVTADKSMFPNRLLADYLLTTYIADGTLGPLEQARLKDPAEFDPADYAAQTSRASHLRLPSPTYPGLARNVIYDADIRPVSRKELKLPLDFASSSQGVFSSYSDHHPDAAWMHLYVRPGHYLGAGHHHADAGMFHFSALGVDWFTQSAFTQAYDGDYFSLVQVDGLSEARSLPEAGILGWNAAAKYLGAVVTPAASAGSADLTYAYTYRWLTQPPQLWNKHLLDLAWELDTAPENLLIWAGTARYKLRPWWPNYTFGNYIPTCRALFNPMQYVFRTTGLVRGEHAYGFVLDDAKKDENRRLYQWIGVLNGGVWKADAPGLAPNQVVLAFRRGDPKSDQARESQPITPENSEPLLLVCAVGLSSSGDPGLPLLQVERVAAGANQGNSPKYLNRLAINVREAQVRYRVLMIPFRAGDPIPQLSALPNGDGAKVRIGNQVDTLQFLTQDTGRTLVVVSRNKKIMLQSQ